MRWKVSAARDVLGGREERWKAEGWAAWHGKKEGDMLADCREMHCQIMRLSVMGTACSQSMSRGIEGRMI